MPSSASTLTRSVGSWLRSVPLARFTHGEAGALEGVGVRAAAGGDARRLVAAGAQRPLGDGDPAARARRSPVAVEHPLDGRRRGRTRAALAASWRWSTISVDERLGPGARRALRTSASIRQRSGTTLIAVPPRDRADVGGRLRRRAGRAASPRSPRAAATIALRPSSGRMPACAARPRKLGHDPVVGRRARSRSRRSAWRGRTRSRSGCAAARRRTRCAPRATISSPTVNSSSSPTGGGSGAPQPAREREQRRRPPPCCRRRGSPSLAFSQPPSTSTGSTGAVSGTVSRCAQSRMLSRAPAARDAREQVAAVRAGPRPGVVLLDLEPERRAARAATRSAQARSWPDGLSIAAQLGERVVEPLRARASVARRLEPAGAAALGAAARARAPRVRVAGARALRARGVLQGGADEVAEQRRGPLRARLELGVELRGDEERVLSPAARSPRRGARRARCPSRRARRPRGACGGGC